MKARQIQVHHEETEEAKAGQRTAINIGGMNKNELKRGDVLVSSDHFLLTKTIDVALRFVHNLSSPIKQRAPVKVHIGTSEIMGKIIFFDRNELKNTTEEVLCQIRLEEEIVVRRGDRFILRRPTPVETLGGGWVIQPKGRKYRFGEETIKLLHKQMEGSPEDMINDVLGKHKIINVKELIQYTSLDENETEAMITKGIQEGIYYPVPGQRFGLVREFNRFKEEVIDHLQHYHQTFTMRQGLRKAELIQTFSQHVQKEFVEHSLNVLIDHGDVMKEDQFVFLPDFQPHLPHNWKKRMEQIISTLKHDGVTPKKWDEYVKSTPLSKEATIELSSYLLQTNQAYWLTEGIMIHQIPLKEAIVKLKQSTGSSFNIAEAKDALHVSRKYLIPFLELLDSLKLTSRQDGDRQWTEKKQNSFLHV